MQCEIQHLRKKTPIMHSPTARRVCDGFTLTELMVVIAIVAIAAAVAVPSIQAGVQERRTSQAALDFVRLARRARLQAMGSGRAWLLRYDLEGSPFELGRLRLFRGLTSRCNANDWATITAGPECGEVGSSCVEQVELGSPQYRTSSSSVILRAAIEGDVDVCYQPSGIVLLRNGPSVATALFSAVNNVGGGVLFELQRREGSTEVGVRRQVLVSLSGDARVLR